jgi:hypothetical protein
MTKHAPFVAMFDQHYTVTPFMEGNVVGYLYKRHSDGAECRVYMNPSTEGEGAPDVFIYTARETANPEFGSPECYVTPRF